MKKNNIRTISFFLALVGSGLSWSENLSDQELKDLETARIALERGSNNQALEILDALYAQHPDQDEIANNFAVALFNDGQAAEAGIVLQSYLERHAQVGTASNNLFRVYDFLAAESYAMLSGSEPELPKLDLLTATQAPLTNETARATESPVALRNAPDQSQSEVERIKQRLQGYLAAWSSGDAQAYMSFYIPERSPVRGQGFERWKEERERKIFPERDISVNADELQIMPVDESQAIAVFRQSYRASNYSDETTKQLTWLKQGGEWYIRYETALPN